MSLASICGWNERPNLSLKDAKLTIRNVNRRPSQARPDIDDSQDLYVGSRVLQRCQIKVSVGHEEYVNRHTFGIVKRNGVPGFRPIRFRGAYRLNLG